MGNVIPKLIIPVKDIAKIAMKHWPEPTRYQATIMTTIALMESGGDARAWYYNTEGLFAETFDRGLWGINEAVIQNIMPDWYGPSQFADPESNGSMAWDIWNWRYWQKENEGSIIALPYAYSGWTTYRKARLEKDPDYANAWKILYPKAVDAIAQVP